MLLRFIKEYFRKARASNIYGTFGSTQDDKYYIEYRHDENQPFSFLTIGTEDKDIIVHLGLGINTPYLSIQKLELILKDIEERNIKSKRFDQYNLTISTNLFNQRIVKVGNDNDYIIISFDDFRYLIIQGKQKLIKESQGLS